MDKKFTKGNWIADLRSGCCAVYSEDRKSDTKKCTSHDERNIYYSSKGQELKEDGWEMSEEYQANAKLIAAAPDMLEVCERLIELEDIILPALKEGESEEFKEEYQAIAGLFKQAKQAIKKAIL